MLSVYFTLTDGVYEAMSFTYAFPRPAVTVDCVVFTLCEQELNILLIQRNSPPFRGQWALPGGFVELNETLEEAARRELFEETGVTNAFLEQLYTFGAVNRDPRDRVVTVAYYALVKPADHRVHAASDASDARWFSVDPALRLAFDHNDILQRACDRLRVKVRYQPVGFELLPTKFTLRQLHQLYETILDRPLDKRNFRKKMLGMGLLEELEEVESQVPHRAARLYRFDKQKYKRLSKQGLNFEV